MYAEHVHDMLHAWFTGCAQSTHFTLHLGHWRLLTRPDPVIGSVTGGHMSCIDSQCTAQSQLSSNKQHSHSYRPMYISVTAVTQYNVQLDQSCQPMYTANVANECYSHSCQLIYSTVTAVNQCTSQSQVSVNIQHI